MWLLLAVLFLLGNTEMIGGQMSHALPPIARWGVWTASLLGCGLSSLYHPWGAAHWRMIGVGSITLFFMSYMMMWEDYLALMPEGGHWPYVFVTFNVVLPIAFVAMGPLRSAVRTGE